MTALNKSKSIRRSISIIEIVIIVMVVVYLLDLENLNSLFDKFKYPGTNSNKSIAIEEPVNPPSIKVEPIVTELNITVVINSELPDQKKPDVVIKSSPVQAIERNSINRIISGPSVAEVEPIIPRVIVNNELFAQPSPAPVSSSGFGGGGFGGASVDPYEEAKTRERLQKYSALQSSPEPGGFGGSPSR